jgi:hypothetical protein
MAGNSIEINSNVNDINIQPDFNKITVVNPDGCFVTITQPVTNVIQVATPGPQGPAGPAGPIGPSGSFETGSFVTTSSFNAFTSSIQTEVDNLTSQTGSYVLNSQTGSFATTGSNNFIGNQVITGSLTVSGSSTFTNIGPSIFSGSITVANGNIISNGNATLLGSLTANNVNVKTSTNTATLLSDNITGNYNYYFPPNSGGTLVLRSELPRAGNGLTDTIGFPSTISLGGSVTNNITLADTSNSYIFITEGLGHRIAVFDDNSSPVLDFQRATGTPGSPTAPLANNYLGVIGAGAATLSESGRSAAIIFQATSNFTSGSKGSSIGFYTTPSGSNLSSRVMTVSDDAQVGIGTRYPTNTLHVSGSGKFTDELVVEGNISASGTITATSASFTHISGTISNIIWTVDFTDGELNTTLYAPYNLAINSVTNVYNSPTSSISSSGSPYTLGNAITTGEPIDITVSTGSVINLNITR